MGIVKEETFPKDWFEKFLKSTRFKETLFKLGEFNYFDYESGEWVILKYWTDTRWRISEITGKTYILSPAFWNDEQLETRFALNCAPYFKLMVYVKTPSGEKIIGKIGCYKILIEYSTYLEPLNLKKIVLSPKDELLATIQNLDYFFTEETPNFMSFDYNIVYQALNLIIDQKLASNKLLDLRCDEIKNILLKLIKDEEEDIEFNPQIYIQLKALLDFNAKKWVSFLIKKFDILKYFEKMLQIEEREVQDKIGEITLSLAENFNALSDDIRNFLFKLFEITRIARYFVCAIRDDFNRISENLRNQLLFKFSEKNEIAGDVAMTLAKNFNTLSKPLKDLFSQLSSRNIQLRGMLYEL